jgi:hypothetical protein
MSRRGTRAIHIDNQCSSRMASRTWAHGWATVGLEGEPGEHDGEVEVELRLRLLLVPNRLLPGALRTGLHGGLGARAPRPQPRPPPPPPPPRRAPAPRGPVARRRRPRAPGDRRGRREPRRDGAHARGCHGRSSARLARGFWKLKESGEALLAESARSALVQTSEWRWGAGEKRRATSAAGPLGGCSLGPRIWPAWTYACRATCRAGEVGKTHDSPCKWGRNRTVSITHSIISFRS